MKPLTPQQKRVLALLADGLNHRQVAEVMEMSRAAVRECIVSICEKVPRNRHFRAVIQFILLREP